MPSDPPAAIAAPSGSAAYEQSAAVMTAAAPLGSMRTALFLISLVAVALELTLMRGLALRFWSYFAGMVISVGLLGFSAAGTALTLLRPFVMRRQRGALAVLALMLAVSVPITWWLTQLVPLNVQFLAWSFSQTGNVLAIELFMFVPFLFAGAFVCIALMDRPERISGHYAANLVGSGAGGAIAVLAMHVLTTIQLLLALAALAYLAALLLTNWRDRRAQVAATAALLIAAFTAVLMPWEPAFAAAKSLAQFRNMSRIEEIYRTEGPLGRIDVVAGTVLHVYPGLSVQYQGDLPETALILTDGDGGTPVYNIKSLEDWKFSDYRTAAVPFHIPTASNAPPSVCLIGAGGGSDIGLSLFHHATNIVALEMNQQVIDTLTGPLKEIGGSIYLQPGVHIVNQESRGYFASTRDAFDIIEVPIVGGFGASGSGLMSTSESYLYTVESVRAMYDHLTPTGILAINRSVQKPPREELKAFDLAVQSLRQENVDPATHLAMIRNNFTCTILLFKHVITPPQIAAIREFCQARSFDLCVLPGLTLSESNTYFKVDHSLYFQGPQALMGSADERVKFLAEYPFEISAPTDDKPYFFHNFRWSAQAGLQQKYGTGAHAFLEIGYLMSFAALIQTVLLGAVLVLLPLAPGLGSLRRANRKAATLSYFFMLGFGFMLLEMGFVQKLVLYLAHPIYSAAVVIGSFLVFAGLGSHLSPRWKSPPQKIIAMAVGTILLFAIGFLFALDPWLHLTQSLPMLARCLIASLTIAPLAFAMGHLFPLGLQRAVQTHPALVPWSWAANGFASVSAAAGAPLLAMRFGFSNLVLAAIACYLLAAMLFRFIPVKKVDASTPNEAALIL